MAIRTYDVTLDENRMPKLTEIPAEECKVDLAENPEKVKRICDEMFHLSEQAEEHVVLISIGGNGKIKAAFELSHGGIDQSVMDPRSVMVRLLLTNATAFVIAHNHPSGICEPSQVDIRATKQLKEAADIMGYYFLDHVIVGDGYRSMREENDCQF